jgi:hypothetical protein
MSNFRMFHWALLTVALLMLALLFREAAPASLVAVTVYKAHLMALAGWGGYWLDRALFPYDRPHAYLALEDDKEKAEADASAELVAGQAFGMAMLRRAIIVAACLICVALGA